MADDRYITITGRGPTWTARITHRGVELLKGMDDSGAINGTHQSEADLFIQKLAAAAGLLEVEGGYKLEIAAVGSWQRPKYEARLVRFSLMTQRQVHTVP